MKTTANKIKEDKNMARKLLCAPFPSEKGSVPVKISQTEKPADKNYFNLGIFLPERALVSMLVGAVFAGLLTASFSAYAVYSPGQTTNPSCSPTDPSCTVAPAATYDFGSNNFGGNPNDTGTFSTYGDYISYGSFHNKGTGSKYYFGPADNASISYTSNTLSGVQLIIDPGTTTNVLGIGNGGQSIYSLQFNTATNPGGMAYNSLTKTFLFGKSNVSASSLILTANPLGISSGGTGVDAAPEAGQILIGNINGGYDFANLSGSLEVASGSLSLSGDSALPGNSFYYGTNSSGAKGFYPLPATAGSTGTYLWTRLAAVSPSAGFVIQPAVTADRILLGGATDDGLSFLQVRGDADISGSVTTSGLNLQLSDFAENYPTKDNTLSAGEIVALDPANPGFVARADSSNKTAVLGIVSTAPGVTLGIDKKNAGELKVPLALAGRVPVKVNMEGGAINIGDRIALSSAAGGVGVKAAAGQNTIGIALESFDGNSASTGSILVFVQNQQSVLNSSGTIGNGEVSGVQNVSVGQQLSALGMNLVNGVATLSGINVDTATIKTANVSTANIQKIQMTDSVTGTEYCIWIANGEWQKAEGSCAPANPLPDSQQ